MVWDLGSCYYCDYYQSTWPSPPTIAGVNVQHKLTPMYHCHPDPRPHPDPKGTEVIFFFSSVSAGAYECRKAARRSVKLLYIVPSSVECRALNLAKKRAL